MSQSSLDQSQNLSQNQISTKKFLKKGEGLKRFHAYNPPPPPPSTAHKIKRRQTFVKFKIDEKINNKGLSSYPLPETVDPFKVPEFPRKPKTERTPIRPKRQALGTLKASTFNFDPEDLHHDSSIDFKSNDTSMPTSGNDLLKPPADIELFTTPTITDNSPFKPAPANDLSTPQAGSAILALGKQIEQLQATVDDLRDQVKRCRCGFGQFSPKRVVTRASARRAKAKANDDRPSADADNSTPKIVKNLSGEIARLKDMFDEMNLLR